MRRQELPVLLQAFIVFECLILSLAGGLALMRLGVGIFLESETLAPGILAVAFIGAYLAVFYFSWQQHTWAIWLRAGLSFAIATALVPVAGEHPELWILVVERSLQTALAVWLAART